MMNSRLPFQLRTVGAVRADDRPRLITPALQKRQIEKRINHHARAAGKDFAFLEAEMLLVKVAELLWLLGNKRDVSELTHVSPLASVNSYRLGIYRLSTPWAQRCQRSRRPESERGRETGWSCVVPANHHILHRGSDELLIQQDWFKGFKSRDDFERVKKFTSGITA